MSKVQAALIVLVALIMPRVAAAQSQEADPAPARGTFVAAPLPPPKVPFMFPDLPHRFQGLLRIDSRLFTLKPGVVMLADYNAFSQDEASVSQVGLQENGWAARAARLMFSGTIGGGYKVSYLIAGEYKSFESDPDTTWNITDVSLTFPIRGPATRLTVGKTKETFGYEMVGDAASLPHQERVLTPFVTSRNVGAKVIHVAANQRMTMAAGVFNDWWVKGDGNPIFSGYYVTGSWVLSGETRPYDRTQGYARRVLPAGRWGSPELVLRFSHEDMDDGLAHGGTFDKTYLGFNWWATRRWKFGFGWGHT